jgi:hypothetical protein
MLLSSIKYSFYYSLFTIFSGQLYFIYFIELIENSSYRFRNVLKTFGRVCRNQTLSIIVASIDSVTIYDLNTARKILCNNNSVIRTPYANHHESAAACRSNGMGGAREYIYIVYIIHVLLVSYGCRMPDSRINSIAGNSMIYY